MKKEIPGYDKYEIDELGNVYIKWEHNRRKKMNPSGILKPIYNSNYLCVYLRKNGATYRRLVHQLVLETFVGPRPDGMECRHIDGNYRNNKLSNLRYGTHKANMQDGVKHGVIQRYGSRNGRSKLTLTDVRAIRKLWDNRKTNGHSRASIAEKYGVCTGTVGRIGKRTTWEWA